MREERARGPPATAARPQRAPELGVDMSMMSGPTAGPCACTLPAQLHAPHRPAAGTRAYTESVCSSREGVTLSRGGAQQRAQQGPTHEHRPRPRALLHLHTAGANSRGGTLTSMHPGKMCAKRAVCSQQRWQGVPMRGACAHIGHRRPMGSRRRVVQSARGGGPFWPCCRAARAVKARAGKRLLRTILIQRLGKGARAPHTSHSHGKQKKSLSGEKLPTSKPTGKLAGSQFTGSLRA